MSGAGNDPRSLEPTSTTLTAALDAVSRDLLVYKALFEGARFQALAIRTEDPAEAAILAAISRESAEEADATTRVIDAWNAKPVGAEDVVRILRARMLADLLHLKESTTEAFLLAGMRAPTDTLRRAFVELADVDRRHADALRGLLGARRIPTHELQDAASRRQGASAGAYAGREGEPTFSRRLARAVEELRADGQEPAGLVLSAVALRHARDEGLLGPDDGTALGLPVEVDFGWCGECFAVETRERVTLAELISARVAQA